MKLVMGTRGSPLALAQARQFARQLEQAHAGLTVEERIIRTTGDKQKSAPLPSIGGKGVFTLEIENALRDGEIDFAVHSLKDLPPEMPAGLCLGAIPRRAPANDVCVVKLSRPIDFDGALPFLPHGAKVGTSSLRRRAQLLHLRPDLAVSDVRGNIDTRLRKLDEEFDAIVLARAGLERLGVEIDATRLRDFDENQFVPAPGQGALAIEARTEDEATLRLFLALDDAATRAEVSAERGAMRALNAGCSTPLGARAICEMGRVKLRACVLSIDGTQRIFAEDEDAAENAAALGERVAGRLLELGAGALMVV